MESPHRNLPEVSASSHISGVSSDASRHSLRPLHRALVGIHLDSFSHIKVSTSSQTILQSDSSDLSKQWGTPSQTSWSRTQIKESSHLVKPGLLQSSHSAGFSSDQSSQFETPLHFNAIGKHLKSIRLSRLLSQCFSCLSFPSKIHLKSSSSWSSQRLQFTASSSELSWQCSWPLHQNSSRTQVLWSSQSLNVVSIGQLQSLQIVQFAHWRRASSSEKSTRPLSIVSWDRWSWQFGKPLQICGMKYKF